MYYQKNKALDSSDTSTNKANCNPANTYPLAFNAYNLDAEENIVAPTDVKVKEIETSIEEELPQNENSSLNEEDINREKEKIVSKIFG